MFKMSYYFKIIVSVIFVFSISVDAMEVMPDLINFDYDSASVLPYFTEGKVTYVILSREAYGKHKKGTYDDFGGSRSKSKNDNDPLVTAAREFWEEGMLATSIGLSFDETQNYIANPEYTKSIIAYTTVAGRGQVTYVTDFSPYKNTFIKNFYRARQICKTGSKSYKEKDRIALVKWDDLKKVICEQEDVETAYVNALEVTREGKEKEILIRLRPFIVIKLRPFMRDERYQKGADERVRFYSDYDKSQKKSSITDISITDISVSEHVQ